LFAPPALPSHDTNSHDTSNYDTSNPSHKLKYQNDRFENRTEERTSLGKLTNYLVPPFRVVEE